MDVASAFAESVPAPRPRRLANYALALFGLYVAALFVLVLDQQFDFGLFPPALEATLNAQIRQLGDPQLSAADRQALVANIVNWNEFSVPLLLKAIEKNEPGVGEPAYECLQQIAQQFYNTDLAMYGADPVALRQWWEKTSAKLDEMSRNTPVLPN
jgi:hypothetical protein